MSKFRKICGITSRIYQQILKHTTKAHLYNSFRQSIRSLHIILSVFGISYFHQDSSKKLQRIAYSVCIFVVFITSFLFRILYITPMLCDANKVSHSVIGIQQILSTITIVTIYYQFLFYQTKFVHLLELVTIIEHAFTMLNIKLNYKLFAMKIFCEILAILAFISTSFAFFVIYYNVWNISFIALELFVTINPLLVIILNLMIFINAVWFIRDGIKCIKDCLIHLCAIDSLLLDGQSNEMWTVKLMIIQMPYEFYDKYTQLSRIYAALFEMANHLNEIFGLSNLASMGKCLFEKLHSIY